MNRIRRYCIALLFPFAANAVESNFPLYDMEPDLYDQASLQRGAATYMNYCLGCHSLGYQRYKRTAEDLGIPERLMLEYLVQDPNAKIGDLIDSSITDENSKVWFGASPPDLTLYTQLKGGPEYLYTYLMTFYKDDTRPLGVNNMVYENVGMPHVLLELQGIQEKVCKEVPQIAENGGEMMDALSQNYLTEEVCGTDLVDRGYSPLQVVEGTGSLSPDEYEQLAYDLTNFLYYVGEPTRLERERTGVFVLIFLAFFFVPAYLLAREYKKEIH